MTNDELTCRLLRNELNWKGHIIYEFRLALQEAVTRLNNADESIHIVHGSMLHELLDHAVTLQEILDRYALQTVKVGKVVEEADKKD
jgi:hypothetical protein